MMEMCLSTRLKAFLMSLLQGAAGSGPGCTLAATELVGGDLSTAAGGGGIALERGEAQECFIRCQDAS